MMRAATVSLLFLVEIVIFSNVAIGQTYPIRPIRFVVPFSAGGGGDALARIIGQRLSESLGQQVVIDNRGGAGGIIGVDLVAKAAADGYTILLGHIGTHAINPSLYKKLPYDPVKDFAPITLVAVGENMLVVNQSFAASSVSELIALVKANPSRFKYASGGVGGTLHLAGELFKSMAGVDIIHVPYKGGAPAVTALLANEVDMMFGNMLSVLPLVKAGKLKGLAVAGTKRSKAAPDIPTVAEAGVPGYGVRFWTGVFAAAGTPKQIIVKLNNEIVKVMNSSDVVAKLDREGVASTTSTPDELAVLVTADITKWAKVIRSSGIRAE